MLLFILQQQQLQKQIIHIYQLFAKPTHILPWFTNINITSLCRSIWKFLSIATPWPKFALSSRYRPDCMSTLFLRLFLLQILKIHFIHTSPKLPPNINFINFLTASLSILNLIYEKIVGAHNVKTCLSHDWRSSRYHDYSKTTAAQINLSDSLQRKPQTEKFPS